VKETSNQKRIKKMSTRATYKITTEKRSINPVVFYIHHDGYLSGAIQYIEDAVLHSNSRGTLIESFIRANENAEITESHQVHADTEFQYDITEKEDGEIFISALDVDGKRSILINSPLEEVSSKIIRVPRMGYTTLDIAKNQISNDLKESASLYFEGHIGNASATLHQATSMIQWLVDHDYKLEGQYKVARSLTEVMALKFPGHTTDSFWEIGAGKHA
nr:hypothetical protein [Bacteroidales bacterium]